jgi:ubiquitin carboxyl-terminal hydrolase 34
MNTDFRRFMLNVKIQDTNSQQLVFQTQKLFSYLQNSVRRFVDPSLLVSSIKTYDDTLIDVHLQMDVDEFYNLLFDRWESQLVTPEEKKLFRSFYGGQLVQQVKSKECDHVSERLEPFSAIQCDIKGKGTLQDSLQAYVNGEIMGGGKY